MSAAPQTFACPACGVQVAIGRERCQGCGRVFGEDNRCPSCHAIAAVMHLGDGYACGACLAPRERLPDTVVIGEPRVVPSTVPPREIPHGTPRTVSLAPRRDLGAGVLRGIGIFSLGAGIVSASTAAVAVPGSFGYVLAGLFGTWGAFSGFFALRSASRRLRAVGARNAALREQRILALANERDGKLTATEVARALGTTVIDADAALTALADGTRVTVEVDDEGLLEYHFRELQPQRPSLRARVAVEEEEAAETEDAAGEKRTRR